MTRVKRGVTAHRRHKKVLEQTAGHWGLRHRTFKSANESLLHALSYQYRDRRGRKRQFHRLWIMRINAAAREHGLSYSQFMAGLARNGIDINRKMLAELAVNHQAEFSALAESLKTVA